MSVLKQITQLQSLFSGKRDSQKTLIQINLCILLHCYCLVNHFVCIAVWLIRKTNKKNDQSFFQVHTLHCLSLERIKTPHGRIFGKHNPKLATIVSVKYVLVHGYLDVTNTMLLEDVFIITMHLDLNNSFITLNSNSAVYTLDTSGDLARDPRAIRPCDNPKNYHFSVYYGSHSHLWN